MNVSRSQELVRQRLEDGSINEQSIWSYLWERSTVEPSRLSATALID
jgi:hypothetical protein